ncbi:M48 family metallopeptidase [Pinibacter soli]|uniref:M48 family metallopeptidase n=1 Tax=Pinibacter soli TaxID=3044211 RepID=A0ABT6RGU8_9BACT|nr:M48 family metallopeptidase [Pinibacter soli]MDI3321691.1 M48 family metallopeptidase [Pinibacter soli]
MKKIVPQFLILLLSFFGIWFMLSKVDFVRLLHIKQIKRQSVDQIGKQVWKAFETTNTVIENDTLTNALNKIRDKICNSNHLSIPADSIKIHVLENKEINAFALPGNHLVIYSALIKDCKNPEELAGVMSHEIAHMTRNHVAKKLLKEFGLSVILSSTGSSGGAVLKQISKLLSSTAYDRTLESEADEYAVQYMTNANIDPVNLARFLERMDKESALPSAAYLISTHPNAKARSEAIIAQTKTSKMVAMPVLDGKEWESVKGQ